MKSACEKLKCRSKKCSLNNEPAPFELDIFSSRVQYKLPSCEVQCRCVVVQCREPALPHPLAAHALGLPVCGNTSHAPGNITGWPGILPPEAGNFTVTVILPPGPTVILPSGGNITAPVGNVTGWAGILPAGLVIFQAGGDIPGLWRRDSRPARGCSRRWGGYSPPPCGRMCRGV